MIRKRSLIPKTAEQHPVPVLAQGMKDEFGVSGTAEACMEHYGLTANGIADLAARRC